MEALLILGAIASGIHIYEHSKENKEIVLETTKEVIYNGGLDSLDWSKAGNFRTTSTENDVQWVIITEG